MDRKENAIALAATTKSARNFQKHSDLGLGCRMSAVVEGTSLFDRLMTSLSRVGFDVDLVRYSFTISGMLP